MGRIFASENLGGLFLGGLIFGRACYRNFMVGSTHDAIRLNKILSLLGFLRKNCFL